MPSVGQAPKPSRDEVLSLEVLARRAPVEEEQPTQFRVLVRHFLDRFFTNELASARAMRRRAWCRRHALLVFPASWWRCTFTRRITCRISAAVLGAGGDHYFTCCIRWWRWASSRFLSGICCFPTCWMCSCCRLCRCEAAECCARGLRRSSFDGRALFDSSFLAPIVLPAATDPPHLFRFWAAHLLAVAASGIFGAAFFLALEGILLGVLGIGCFAELRSGCRDSSFSCC